jgi:hypothetical protein
MNTNTTFWSCECIGPQEGHVLCPCALRLAESAKGDNDVKFCECPDSDGTKICECK